MKLQARFLLVYFALFIGAMGLVVLQRTLDIFRAQTVMLHELQVHKTYYQKIAGLEGAEESALATDYSFWDDFVTFIHSPTDPTEVVWAQQNLDTALSTYGVDSAWVYNAQDKLVYYTNTNGDTPVVPLNIPSAALTKLSHDKFDHFYVEQPGGLMEIRAATVVPSSDINHDTSAQGYWLVGRFINQSYLARMADLTQASISLDKPTHSVDSVTTSSSVSFGAYFTNWNGSPLAVLYLTTPVPVETDLENLYSRQLELLIAFFIASAVVVIWATWWLVLRPVRLITMAIAKEQPEALTPIIGSKTEFGNLAQTVDLSFRQKIKIDESEFLKSKLEDLNQAKGEFLAIAAHELRGPVGNVGLFAANMEDLLTEKATNEQLNTELERIRHQTHKATVLINDMYQASKGGRTIDFVNKEFDFDAFVKEEVADAQYATPQHIALEGATHAQVTTDPDRLGQVVSNLLRNASKYSPKDQTIIVRLTESGGRVQMEVQDFGIGIDEADKPKLFTRFYRSSRVTKDYPGLGLGLSVCKEVIEALGGRIWFTSQLGAGSHFYVSLPASPRATELS